jgi:transcriptional regulator GlxA family with amidase domain
VLPDADFATPLQADLLLVPGGVVDRAMACPDTLAWVRRMHAASRWTASVCTGAFILAQAGVLTHQHVTTHWEDQADLQRQFPALHVHSGVRWVSADGGRITTSAGISAGIDMSLHLVATMADSHMRALGLDGNALANRTAHQMEYTPATTA